MSFTTYLRNKATLLIWWFAVHGTALFVNKFGVEGKVNNSLFILAEQQGPWKKPSKSFWPFVRFIKEQTYATGWTEREKVTEFYGIFYKYDTSEFIAYSAAIFLILFVRWNKKQKTISNTA